MQGALGFTQYFLARQRRLVVEFHLAGATAAWSAIVLLFYLSLHRHPALEVGADFAGRCIPCRERDACVTRDQIVLRTGERDGQAAIATVGARTDHYPMRSNRRSSTASMIGEDRRPDRPWLVIVWNDPINLMSYVTFVFQKLFGYSLEKATKLMLDVHHTPGRMPVVSVSGTRERAEPRRRTPAPSWLVGDDGAILMMCCKKRTLADHERNAMVAIDICSCRDDRAGAPRARASRRSSTRHYRSVGHLGEDHCRQTSCGASSQPPIRPTTKPSSAIRRSSGRRRSRRAPSGGASLSSPATAQRRPSRSDDEADGWLSAINDLRLALGTRLGVTEELRDVERDRSVVTPTGSVTSTCLSCRARSSMRLRSARCCLPPMALTRSFPTTRGAMPPGGPASCGRDATVRLDDLKSLRRCHIEDTERPGLVVRRTANRRLEPPSSSGLGHRPFKAETRVRIPLGVRRIFPGRWRSLTDGSSCQIPTNRGSCAIRARSKRNDEYLCFTEAPGH